jgi:predicted nucleic acid-binding Zn ribbon protein
VSPDPPGLKEDDPAAELSTSDGGQLAPAVDSGPDAASDLAQDTLRAAQRMARATPVTRARFRSRGKRRQSGYSGPRPDDRDPVRAREVLTGLVRVQGWERPLAEARLFANWAALVGPEIAAHCQPVALTDGLLRVTATSTAWATQLRLLASSMLARLAAELGPTLVTRLHITGPVAPSWNHGPRAVRGARGPRDTYG